MIWQANKYISEAETSVPTALILHHVAHEFIGVFGVRALPSPDAPPHPTNPCSISPPLGLQEEPTACFPRLNSLLNDFNLADTGDFISSVGKLLAGSGEIGEGSPSITRLGISITSLPSGFLDPEELEAPSCKPAAGAAPPVLTLSGVPQNKTLVGNTGDSGEWASAGAVFRDGIPADSAPESESPADSGPTGLRQSGQVE